MKRVYALGFFDGVHIGHGKLLTRAVRRARETGATACALTFDRHPLSVVKSRPVPLLCGLDEREQLIKTLYHVPHVVALPFNDALRHMPREEFVRRVLLEEMKACHVVVGYDFTFGYKGEGDPQFCETALAEAGAGCDIIPPERIQGIRVSSTYIRGLVAEGDMEQAAAFLGHPYRLTGTVVPGNGLGRQFGYPTVNIPLSHDRQWPAWGVYATQVVCEGTAYTAVTNVGIRPTVERGGAPTVESTLLDFSGNLYGQRIEVLFNRFLRPEQKFPSVNALQEQISKDIASLRTHEASNP